MGRSAGTGPLRKAVETVKVFAERRPSLDELWASRTGSFDRLHAIVPSTLAVGERATLTLQAWDEYERLFSGVEGPVSIESTDPDATVPAAVRFPATHDGVARFDLSFGTPGLHYLVFHYEGERFVSNPVRVTAAAPERRVYWGDLHLHSLLSDGTGSIEKGMRFGRDVMALDVVAYTDHDTMGFFIPPQLQRRRMHRRYFDRMKTATQEFHDPGEFVTLFGYEWTKQPNVGGHINVYFDGVDDATLFDSLARETNTYESLWARLRAWRDEHDGDVLTVPHHPAEAMYPFDFSAVEYDDDLAPLVEVYSQWGSSERPGAEGNRFPLAMGQGEVKAAGHYAQDALRLGYRVGLIASSDYHGPHPGHSLLHADPHLPSLREWLDDGIGWSNIWRVWNEPSYPGGLQAFSAPELTRASIFDAMRSRRTYGTTQPHRILVDFAIDGVAVGERDSTVTVDARETPREVAVSVAGTAPLQRVRVIKNNRVWQTVEGTANPDAPIDDFTVEAAWTDDDPVCGMQWDHDRGTGADVYYVRVTQASRPDDYPGMAWAGPIWVMADAEGADD
jgi:hypothetical protein